MKIEEALEESKKVLNSKRFEHVERVTDTAFDLAERFQGNQQQVGLAAALHDYAKDMELSILKDWIIAHHDISKDLLAYHHELWHGPVGAKMAEKLFLIKDDTIQNAIYWHTTGRKGMTKTEKIVFLADYIEPGRDFPAVYQAREIAKEGLNQACHYALTNSIHFLMSRQQPIYPATFQAYNDFTKRLLK
ncbi:bis(5'-nucleosyl)-tetraphosphatase (symmetrical) YqeK [Tenuibacillus multivorans]|uniref:bis(5'-nucleosyl)-tetraphosphatase (symmetrical) n=1 Tax=Tenuibacillus multivorans TaxID=237069 RepID=A0A1G9ZG97_9BACI|nr:bis(5'-nucleosyl)-tetraphosphatase (symmetrical) YqeK [Tenuibacillus multivorans]GEL77522.1 HD domain-containing protein [Tenuibacillus multivorans]SDN20127.1 putative HD superfamily hydrolase of NAD metabolism [Tenuibacillus multivorans]